MQTLSIIIPVYNECESIKSLIIEIENVITNKFKYEVIIINDGSTDNTYELITNEIKNPNVYIYNNEINMGQSYSINKGIKLTNYTNIVTIDGDGQNPPKDIIKLANLYFSNKYKLVGGLRLKRRDSIIKKISSRIANSIRSYILKDNCSDTGCSLKIFDKEFFLKLPYFNGMHRFLPALFINFGAKTHFIEVGHRQRKSGKSKYGTFDRLIIGIKDLIKVLYLIKSFKNE